MAQDGSPFLVIGHNEAMSWPGLAPLFRHHDIAGAERYISMLAAYGITVIRLMLEYFDEDTWFFEEQAGVPNPSTVECWDALIKLCERHGMRLLVVFWDTFHMVQRWGRHPYAAASRSFSNPVHFCTSPDALDLQKHRIAFFVDRWGGSGAVFGYELMNEIGPEWGGSVHEQSNWISAIASFTRERELAKWGKNHLLTVSCFGPSPTNGYADLIFRHPELDFSTTHVYDFGTIDNPENTIGCAITMASAVRYAAQQSGNSRPYIDSENGPIHLYLDLKRQLPDEVDAEYYHNIAWAHLASGGAGSGMRWPFRHPHCLTTEMHKCQRAMANFASSIDWVRFAPHPVPPQVNITCAGRTLPLLVFGCFDSSQMILWLLRDSRRLTRSEPLPASEAFFPDLEPGTYSIAFWDTRSGTACQRSKLCHPGGRARLGVPSFERDLAISISKLTCCTEGLGDF